MVRSWKKSSKIFKNSRPKEKLERASENFDFLRKYDRMVENF